MHQEIFVRIELSVHLDKFHVLCHIRYKINFAEIWHSSSNVYKQDCADGGYFIIFSVEVNVLELLHLHQALNTLHSELTGHSKLQSPEIKLLKT